MRSPNPPLACILVVAALFTAAQEARAMCGCMLRPRPKVGETKAAKIVNKSSKVILARDGETTVMTLANDFEGAPVAFGLVVPVPTAIHKEDVKVVDDKVFDTLEAATAPNVTEIFEDDGCGRGIGSGGGAMAPSAAMEKTAAAPRRLRAADYGVKVESHFFAGEYEMAVLSGKDGNGLVEWLQKFDYDIPDDAKEVMQSYVRQKMMFFLARVYVKEMGTQRRHLRPIQVRYNTPKLMLPIRLGMVNADGPQELMVFALTKGGRVESTNYRTVKMPTGAVLPGFVKDSWNEVYGAIFDEQEKREGNRVVFLEAGRGLPADANTKKAGQFWGDGSVFVTRMHFRYTPDTFPEDLVLQTTSDTSFFSVNMTAVKPAPNSCNPAGQKQARYQEQQTMANITGWPIEKVIAKGGGKVGSDDNTPPPPPADPKWYDKLWK